MANLKIGFTGTQQYLDRPQRQALYWVVRSRQPAEAHHGDCVGADAWFDGCAMVGTTATVVIHPPDNPVKRAFCGENRGMRRTVLRRPKPYLDRNSDIVNETDELIACPKEFTEQLRSGTWATVRRARKAKKPITFVWPDGSITTETS